MRALSTRTGTDASRPFDVSRDGFVMGEGAAALVLEEAQHAIDRGVHIICEIRGYAATCDATHITASDEEGSGGLRAMQQALGDAGLTAEHVDHINAHATSTPRGDAAEAAAIARLLKLYSVQTPRDVSVTSVKGALGHLLAAAGLKALLVLTAFYLNSFLFSNSRCAMLTLLRRCNRGPRHSVVCVA
jgi:3-oxoacyl-[acyl-carrier-protein] synthase II